MLFLASQKLILTSWQGYFPNLNRLTQSVSRLSRDNYTPAFPINSPPEVYEHTQRERLKEGEETAKQRSILLLPRIQRTTSLIRVLIP